MSHLVLVEGIHSKELSVPWCNMSWAVSSGLLQSVRRISTSRQRNLLNQRFLLANRLGNRPSRTGGLQVEIPRVNYKVGKESAQYRGPVIWNFIARLANFNANIQKDTEF